MKFVNRKLAAIIIVLAIALSAVIINQRIFWSNVPSLSTETSAPAGNRKTALIGDGLSQDFPNPSAVEEWASILRSAGYEVTLVSGSNVNLTLYKHLTNYDVVILRIHGGIGKIVTPLYTKKFNALFTGVEWSDKYEPLRKEGLVARGHPFFINKTYVAVKEAFFLKELKSSFRNGSVMIVAGCYALYTDDIWHGLSRKGLHTFIGWRGKVTPTHMDKVVTQLLKKVFEEGLSWQKAVEEVNKELGPDPLSNETLVMKIRR